MPDWRIVAEQITETGLISVDEMRGHFSQWRVELEGLPHLLEEFPLPASVSVRVMPLVNEVKNALARAEV